VAVLLRGRLVTIGTPMDLTAAGSGLTKVSVRSERGTLVDAADLPAVRQHAQVEDYVVAFTADISVTVAAILSRLDATGDPLVDLRVERPSLEERFLELTAEETVR